MADNMSAIFAAGQNVTSVSQNRNSSDELVYNTNAHAFFLTFGKPVSKVEHQFFTKKDGQSKLEGLQWNRPFFGQIKSVFIGKNLASEGMGLKELAAELQNESTTFEIHIRKGSEEAYISRPRSLVTGNVDDLF